MNKPHKHAEIIKAWADGATIEYQTYNGTWVPISHPPWLPSQAYRVKPEPKLVPFSFEDADKIIGKVVKGKIIGNVFLITGVTKHGSVKLANDRFSFESLLDSFTFLDGSPCGKIINE